MLWKQAKRVECHGSVNNFCWTSFWGDSIELVSTKKYGQGRMVLGHFLLAINGRIAFFILSLSPCYFHQLLLSFYLSPLFSFWARWICGLFHRTLSIIWNLLVPFPVSVSLITGTEFSKPPRSYVFDKSNGTHIQRSLFLARYLIV